MPIEFSSSEAEEYYQQALTHEDQSEKEQARECYRLVVEIDPLHPELWCRLGLVSPTGEDYIAFDNALRCQALTAEELYWRGRAALAYHHDVDSLRDLAASVALDPRVAYRWLDQYAETLGEGRWYPGWEQDPQGAQAPALAARELQFQCYKRLIDLYPTDRYHHYYLALFYEQHDHLPEAIAAYSRAIALGPHPRFITNRGMLRFITYDFKGALQDLTHRHNCAKNHWRGGWTKIYHPDPNQPTPCMRWAQALEAFDTAGPAQPTDPQYLKSRFDHYRLHRQHALALGVAEALVAAEPDRADLRELRIQCHLALPEPDVAALLVDYEWLAEMTRPRTKEELSGYGISPEYYRPRKEQCRQLHCCAWAHYRLGDHTAALQCFAAAMAIVTAEEATDESGAPTLEHYWSLPVHDPGYLLWQLQQQLPRNWTAARSHWNVTWWMACAIARVPYQLVPNLAEAFEVYLPLSLPPQTHHPTPPAPHQYEQALALCAAGAAQADAVYAGLYASLQRNVCKSRLRQALNEPTATPASRAAALARYDAACVLPLAPVAPG